MSKDTNDKPQETTPRSTAASRCVATLVLKNAWFAPKKFFRPHIRKKRLRAIREEIRAAINALSIEEQGRALLIGPQEREIQFRVVVRSGRDKPTPDSVIDGLKLLLAAIRYEHLTWPKMTKIRPVEIESDTQVHPTSRRFVVVEIFEA